MSIRSLARKVWVELIQREDSSVFHKYTKKSDGKVSTESDSFPMRGLIVRIGKPVNVYEIK